MPVAARSSSERGASLPIRLDLERIAVEARDHVQVEVEDVLECGLAESATKRLIPSQRTPRAPDRLLHPHRDPEDMCAGVLVDVRHRGRVLLRDEQDVTGIDGMEVHEAEEAVVFVDDACLALTRDESAEDAVADEPAIRAPVSK